MSGFTEPEYHCAVRGHPMIKETRWYVGDPKSLVIMLDQPMVGFPDKGACEMYIRDMGKQWMPNVGSFGGHRASEGLVAVPAVQVTG